MPTYEFRCEDCANLQTLFKQISETIDPNWNQLFYCEKCNGHMYQTWTQSPAMIVSETNEVESAKPGSYWRNAETVKQEGIKKRRAVEAEKLAYGDKEAVQKQENLRRNSATTEDNAPDNI